MAPLAGAATGAVTAVLGAGGGFLIVPALVLLLGVPMAKAVPASLLIIALQAVAGAAGAVWARSAVDVPLAALLLGVMIAGVAAGTAGADRVAPVLLRRTFGWLVLVVAGAMAVTELL
mgnify:CR=1 FL=1